MNQKSVLIVTLSRYLIMHAQKLEGLIRRVCHVRVRVVELVEYNMRLKYCTVDELLWMSEEVISPIQYLTTAMLLLFRYYSDIDKVV